MEPKINKISVISIIIILFLISIPAFFAYYLTDVNNDNFFQDAAQRKIYPEFQEDSKIFDNRVVLRKDKSITLKKNKLIFKGLEDKMIRLDVYLLELDPEYAYPHYISESDALNEIRVGDLKFQLLKVNKKTLQLKIVDIYQS